MYVLSLFICCRIHSEINAAENIDASSKILIEKIQNVRFKKFDFSMQFIFDINS